MAPLIFLSFIALISSCATQAAPSCQKMIQRLEPLSRGRDAGIASIAREITNLLRNVLSGRSTDRPRILPLAVQLGASSDEQKPLAESLVRFANSI